MHKVLIYTSVAIALSACGGGSSSDNPDTNNTSGTEVSDDATSEGATTNDEITENGATVDEPEAGDSGGNAESDSEPEITGTDAGSAVTQFGSVNLEVGESVDISALFISLSQQIPFDPFEELVPTNTDTCVVSELDLEFEGEVPVGSDPLSELGIVSISAGEVLTISSPAGSYAELIRREFSGFIAYSLDGNVELSTPVPSDLNISIPGDEFVAFTNVGLPAVEPLQVSSPGRFDAITANTTFSWTASANPDSFVEISAFAPSEDFMSLRSVECQVIDDGSFVFSAETKAELADFSGNGDVDRYGVKVLQQGSSVLLLSTYSERVN